MMRLLIEYFKYKSLQLMHYSALVYDLYALKCSHTPQIILSLFLMLHQTIEHIKFNSIHFSSAQFKG